MAANSLTITTTKRVGRFANGLLASGFIAAVVAFVKHLF